MNAREARYKLEVARTLLGTGMLHPVRPDKTLRSLAALQRWGPTPAAAYTGAAIRYPDRAALIDDRGALTFAQVHARTNDLAPEPALEDLIAAGDDAELAAPAEKGRVVILTSGTTGAPKGAARKQPDTIEPAAALFSKIPLKAREVTMIAAPMFHSWGFAHFTLALPLASTLVLRRKFDPEETLGAVSQHRATALAVVPVMLQRILELPRETIARFDTSSLKVIAASGSVLPGELATRAMDTFGDVL